MSTDEKIKKPFMTVEETPQPHFIPGYTGFCPELPHGVGASYARVTNNILKERPEIAGRRSPVDPMPAKPQLSHAERVKAMERDKKLINSRFPNEGNMVLNDFMVPGYGGHVPNIHDTVGMTYTKGCIKAIAQFIRDQKQQEENTSL